MSNAKATALFFFILALCCIGGIGCGDDVPAEPPGPWVGTPSTPPLPEPTVCHLTPNDRAKGVGLFECEAREAGVDDGCYLCQGEFVVPPEGCFLYPGESIESFCAQRCAGGPKYPCQER